MTKNTTHGLLPFIDLCRFILFLLLYHRLLVSHSIDYHSCCSCPWLSSVFSSFASCSSSSFSSSSSLFPSSSKARRVSGPIKIIRAQLACNLTVGLEIHH
eukprot:GHVT01029057.1.p1 GENE.GHVT01029057.1~~GHVT01029057.1.p1  ORF type:complete len:100 (-),score=4.69 GHVT01029057.1:143-442(-)